MSEASQPAAIPIILGVDVEPDDFNVPRESRPPWRGFELMVEYLAELRPRLAEATNAPVHFSWFLRMDPQVAESYGSPSWVVDTYGPAFAEMRSAGDCLGLHPHAWRWEDPPGRWVNDYADPAWVETAMRTAFGAFAAAFGEPCLAHRFGDWYMSPQVVGILRTLGVRYDLTVEPGARGAHAEHRGTATFGGPPDHAAAPRRLYRPSDGDPFRPAETAPTGPDDDPLWMIPVTAFDGDPLMPPWRRVARRWRDRGRPRHRPMSLLRPWDAAGFWRLTQAHLDDTACGYLAFMIRSDAPLRGPAWDSVVDKLDVLTRDPLVSRLRFATPAEAVAQLLGEAAPSAPR